MSLFSITRPDGSVEGCDTLPARYADVHMYTDINELVDSEIIPALGEYKDDFDIQAIQDETVAVIFEFNDAGTQLSNACYCMDVADSGAFWDIVQAHDLIEDKTK